MYNAYADGEDDGSTCLHGDVADALNLMVYASDDGSAIWHVFRRQDAEHLAMWMRQRFRCIGHPVHQQKTYLKLDDLTDLRAATGIQPYVIEQRPGEMVFIPVGCAHQVGCVALISFTYC